MKFCQDYGLVIVIVEKIVIGYQEKVLESFIINCTPDLDFVNMSSIIHYRYPMRDGAKGDSNWKAMKNGSDMILKQYGY
tara:strand:+ start:138 stop:374 length:237 start_codon:yes stop_codon:yes gene_type:complete